MGKENTISKWIKLDVDEFKLNRNFCSVFGGPQPLPSNKAKKKKKQSVSEGWLINIKNINTISLLVTELAL